jgi:hypothetical protein
MAIVVFFKCFSCGVVGGNALSFVREYAKLHGSELSFLEAVKLLDDMMVTAATATVSDAKPVLPVDITVPLGARRDGIKNWWYHPKEVTTSNLFFQQSSSDYPTARFTRQFTCGSLP